MSRSSQPKQRTGNWALLCLAVLAVGATPNPPSPAILNLEKLGNVRYTFSDLYKPAELPGKTTFRINYPYEYTFAHRIDAKASGSEAVITVRMTAVSVQVSHTVSLPTRYAGTAFRHDSLVRHELDHVAISADARPARILRHLLENLTVIRSDIPPGTQFTPQLARRLVAREVHRRADAVTRLIQFNYDLLDSKEVSNHGRRWINDRKGFFAGLYTALNLDEARFEFQAEVQDLLRRADYLPERPLALNAPDQGNPSA